MAEAHVADPSTDAAERALLAQRGFASLLMTPVIAASRPLGLLEFEHREYRRWSHTDMIQARIVAEHAASALIRMMA